MALQLVSDGVDQEQPLLAAIDYGVGFVEKYVNEGGGRLGLRQIEQRSRTITEKHPIDEQIDRLAAELTPIRRSILLSEKHWENDSEHTIATALIAWKVSRQYAPGLDAAEVLTMALVHELAETITGDVPTFNMTPEQLAEKKLNDDIAGREFIAKYANHPKLIEKFQQYENKTTPEALFVYWIDKIMTIFSHYEPNNRAHFFASEKEIYECDGLACHGQNGGNHETITNWYSNTQDKLLAAGRNPQPICKELLDQGFIWLEWLAEYYK